MVTETIWLDAGTARKVIVKRKHSIVSKFLLLSLFSIILTSACIEKSKSWTYKGEPVVIYVNSVPVVLSEFDFFKRLVSTKVKTYYKEKYGLKTFQNFWNNTYGNSEDPKITLNQFAIEASIQNKIQDIFLKENGVIDSIDFNSFKNSLRQENSNRRALLKNGAVIYGPQQYSDRIYHNYLQSNAIIALKRKMGSKIDSSQLRARYIKMKEITFKIDPDITIGLVSIPYGPSTIYTQEEALLKIQELKRNISTVDDFVQRLKTIRTIRGVELLEKYTLESEQNRGNGERFGDLFNHMEKLEKGDVTLVINTDHRASILICYDKKNNGYRTFEEVKSQLESLEIDDWFINTVNDKITKADILLNNSILKANQYLIKKEGFSL